MEGAQDRRTGVPVRIRKVAVQNFRGIRECEWHVASRLSALVGPGDSTKTTLLDAVGLALSPSHTVQFNDADFHACDTSAPISIEVAVTELPEHMIQESQFGKDRSGIRPDGTLEHDPIDGTEECLLIRLTVTEDLDPTWEVVRPGEDAGKTISASKRQRLGYFRVGDRVDLHLRWARTSALSALTEQRSGASAVVLAAQRLARQAVFDAAPEELADSSKAAQDGARRLGSAAFQTLRPGIEPGNSSSAHALVLHDDQIPLTNFGLGSRRLTSLSIQEQAVEGGSIVVIDEVEHGLEPHRLAHVLRHLKSQTSTSGVQVLLTTHSPIAVETLEAADLAVVRNREGVTTVRDVPSELDNVQGALRSGPSAVLSRRVLVGEGPTEVGFVRGLLRAWDQERLADDVALSPTLGVAVVNGGGGSQPIQRATFFNELGYPTAALLDNDDRAIDTAVATLDAGTTTVIRWAHGKALEDELVGALSDAGLQDFVHAASQEKGEESVAASVASRLGIRSLNNLDPQEWATTSARDGADVRFAVAQAAKDKGWFKKESGGEMLAELLVDHWQDLKTSSLAGPVQQLREFAYAVDRSEAGDAPRNDDA